MGTELTTNSGIAAKKIAFLIQRGSTLLSNDGKTCQLKDAWGNIATIDAWGRCMWNEPKMPEIPATDLIFFEWYGYYSNLSLNLSDEVCTKLALLWTK
jgi:hypothetical protein